MTPAVSTSVRERRMNINPGSEKGIPVLSAEVVRSLDTLHRAIAEVMAERGEIIISDGGRE